MAGEADRRRKLAIIVSRGSFNNLFQVATLVRSATALDWSVRVLFRDESVLKLTAAHVNDFDLSDSYQGIEGQVRERLQSAEFQDMRTFLKDSKEHGDDVRYCACTSSMYLWGLKTEDLISEVDEAKTLTTFLLEDVAEADTVLTF